MRLRASGRVSLYEVERDLEALKAPVENAPAYEPATRERPAPKGWTPGVQYVSAVERIITTPPIAGDLLEESGWRELLGTMAAPLPPGWRIELVDASLDTAAWTRDVPYREDGKTKKPATTAAVWRYKFRARFDPKAADRLDIEALTEEIRGHVPGSLAPPTVAGDGSFCVLVADWQIGKVDGDGLRGTLTRVRAMIDAVEARIAELRAGGRHLDELVVFCAGDMVEGCNGFYAMQTFSVELDRREQVKHARRLFRDALMRWAPLFRRVTVTGVGGNHGENRYDGKAYTSFSDNDDVALIEQVAEILDGRPGFEHVRFVLPTDHLAITVPVAGHVVGLTHGHLAKVTGSTPEAKIHRWYEQQAGGKLPIGDADLLLTGHYHSFALADWGGCTWLQGPTLDGGSRWFTDTTGRYARQGTLTFTLHPEAFLRDLAIV